MTYTSLAFAAFAVCLLLVYYLVPRRGQWMVLSVASIIFYAISGPKYLLYVLVTGLTTYLAALLIKKQVDKDPSAADDSAKARKAKERNIQLIMVLSVVLDLGILIVLKYADFIISNINVFLPSDKTLPLFSFVLPLGLSFYTFSAVGYVVDVARSKYDPEHNFFKFFLYLTYFPQIIQGPIPRFDNLAPQLYKEHAFNFETLKKGFWLILWGVFKKVLIADAIAGIVAAMLRNVADLSGAEVWIGMVVWGIQLYADFSGGVDVSRGLSQMLDIEMEINFTRPYLAVDLSDYWNRWHISLGNWLKDYFFYPVALSTRFSKITKATKKRFGKFVAKTLPVGILSLILFTIIGIWHGANWGEVLFGVFNGLVILSTTLLEPAYSKLRKLCHVDGKLYYRIFCSIRTFIIITLARVISLPSNISIAGTMYGKMFGAGEKAFFSLSEVLLNGSSITYYIPALVGCLVLFGVSLYEEKSGGSLRDYISRKPAAVGVILAALGTVLIVVFGAYGIGYEASNFIYSNY